jgi:hypothetical protein
MSAVIAMLPLPTMSGDAGSMLVRLGSCRVTSACRSMRGACCPSTRVGKRHSKSENSGASRGQLRCESNCTELECSLARARMSDARGPRRQRNRINRTVIDCGILQSRRHGTQNGTKEEHE